MGSARVSSNLTLVASFFLTLRLGSFCLCCYFKKVRSASEAKRLGWFVQPFAHLHRCVGDGFLFSIQQNKIVAVFFSSRKRFVIVQSIIQICQIWSKEREKCCIQFFAPCISFWDNILSLHVPSAFEHNLTLSMDISSIRFDLIGSICYSNRLEQCRVECGSVCFSSCQSVFHRLFKAAVVVYRSPTADVKWDGKVRIGTRLCPIFKRVSYRKVQNAWSTISMPRTEKWWRVKIIATIVPVYWFWKRIRRKFSSFPNIWNEF